MPFVKIEIIKGKTPEYKKTIMDIVHNGLVSAIHIDDNDRFQRLYELDDANFEKSGDKSDQFTMIEIIMFPGRTKEQKAKIYEEITNGLFSALLIKPSDVFITIQDPPPENWGLAGKQKDGC